MYLLLALMGVNVLRAYWPAMTRGEAPPMAVAGIVVTVAPMLAALVVWVGLTLHAKWVEWKVGLVQLLEGGGGCRSWKPRGRSIRVDRAKYRQRMELAGGGEVMWIHLRAPLRQLLVEQAAWSKRASVVSGQAVTVLKGVVRPVGPELWLVPPSEVGEEPKPWKAEVETLKMRRVPKKERRNVRADPATQVGQWRPMRTEGELEFRDLERKMMEELRRVEELSPYKDLTSRAERAVATERFRRNVEPARVGEVQEALVRRHVGEQEEVPLAEPPPPPCPAHCEWCGKVSGPGPFCQECGAFMELYGAPGIRGGVE
jgi:hypothetical protein